MRKKDFAFHPLLFNSFCLLFSQFFYYPILSRSASESKPGAVLKHNVGEHSVGFGGQGGWPLRIESPSSGYFTLRFSRICLSFLAESLPSLFFLAYLFHSFTGLRNLFLFMKRRNSLLPGYACRIFLLPPSKIIGWTGRGGTHWKCVRLF